MKTDNYLTLCLEQATKSPLHYRHGCIVVRGGKVIGQGYNDYRPGFNGGAFKHGGIANGGLDGPAMSEVKEKLKKHKRRDKQQQQQCQPISEGCSSATFLPFEGTGGGHHANVPLSMHSEMMAIHSALTASSTLSSTAFACEKPCFKLPGCDKRKARLRAEVLKRYVETVCSTKREMLALRKHVQQSGAQHVQQEWRGAFHVPEGGEKHHHHHQKRKGKEKKNQKDVYQYEYQHNRSGQQTQQFHGLQQHGQGSASRELDDIPRGYESALHNRGTSSAAACNEPPQPEPILLPKAQSGPSLSDRKKHPRLMGADLYVARLGRRKPNGTETLTLPTVRIPMAAAEVSPSSPLANEVIFATEAGKPLAESVSSLPTTTTTSTSGSLHDELIDRKPSPSRIAIPEVNLAPNVVRASRPCYRCISYMHSVGIKRVFWTNDAGEWEGGKVRDLADALDSSMESVAKGADGGPTGNGVFVTKHEVLMLKRLMDDGRRVTSAF
ncbi:hypothetical protein BAUCODRAFT_125860 [Baudoinia panamericana UAMH 10762]|uniref:Uncharacterized protein n=1 Tax=Baudoinia panamericana (strain UAMH 10762) TaxID=717646 RepID=M2MN82_BAUPA|nr:uncharacterized protein BAUCODRAFT_125860 [Baudoinia panamericana UAMH 10762]EMC92903.1 hypothetical protein BAUCODRAFT_125860 [Baudoinia panamericana UAMH 10762]